MTLPSRRSAVDGAEPVGGGAVAEALPRRQLSRLTSPSRTPLAGGAPAAEPAESLTRLLRSQPSRSTSPSAEQSRSTLPRRSPSRRRRSRRSRLPVAAAPPAEPAATARATPMPVPATGPRRARKPAAAAGTEAPEEPPTPSHGAGSTRTAPSRCARPTAGAWSGSTPTARPKRRSRTSSASTPISRARSALLEVRHRRGGASAADLRSAARDRAREARRRGRRRRPGEPRWRASPRSPVTLAAASETEAAAAREAVDEAVRARTELVEKVEAIAARDPRSVQWKQASAERRVRCSTSGSRSSRTARGLPKSTAQQLWKRFRDARATVDKHRREFYAELDEAHKGVRDRKTRARREGRGARAEGRGRHRRVPRAARRVEDRRSRRQEGRRRALGAVQGRRRRALRRPHRARGGRCRGIPREDRGEAGTARRGARGSPTSATSPRRAAR